MAAFSFRRALAASIVQSALHAEVAVAAPLRYNVVAELPLNETGYKQAVAMKSDGVMKEFIRRLVAKFGFGVGDEGVLSGFATHWANATQDYQHLEREVRAVPWFPKDGEMSPLENTTEEVATEVPTPGKARRVNRRLSRLSRDAQSAVQGRTVYGSLDAFHIKTERSHSEEFAPSPLSQLRGEKTHHHRSRALKKTAPTKRAPSLQAKSEPLRHLHEVVSKFGKDARKAVRDQKRAVEDFRHSLRVSLLGVESGSENGARQAVASNATQQTLPAVREVLSTASKSLTDFSADTNHIRKQVEQRQKLLRDKMVVAKDRFEAKLNAYKNQHANLTMVNYELRESIRSVNKTNLALVANASATQRSIRILQDAIVSLRQKVLHAQGFLDDSLNETDFSNATEVQILVPTTPEPSLENFLTKARRELGLKSHSVALLGQAVSVKAKRTAFDSDVETDERGMPKAERMTSMLLDSLENLEKAEMNAYHTLKTNYQSSKEKWVARLTSLLAEQAELKGQLDAVTQMTVELQTANQVVDGTCVLLIRKLEDFGTFLSHVDDAAKKTVAKAKEQGAAQ